MGGQRVTYPMVAVLFGYTCDVLQRWKFPSAKFEGNTRPVEKGESYPCMETLYTLREYESIGMHLRLPIRSLAQLSSLQQVSSGVSVAYLSSIVLLALAASASPSPDGHADTTTYFDSVVFLTMFLLIGMFLNCRTK